MLIARK